MLIRELVNRVTTRDLMAIELSTALIALTFVLAFRAPDSDGFKILLGAMLSTGFASAIGYYFNSSKGSEDKSTTINRTIASATTALATSSPSSPITTTTTEAPAGTTTTTTAPDERKVS